MQLAWTNRSPRRVETRQEVFYLSRNHPTHSQDFGGWGGQFSHGTQEGIWYPRQDGLHSVEP